MKNENQTADTHQAKLKELLEISKTFIGALILAMLFRSFVYDPYHIPSGSMKPNLIEGDYIFVSKFAYGYSRYSFPFGPNLFKGRIAVLNKPERGDIVVFKLPSDNKTNFIKRLIGLPGDKIQVKENILYINNVAVEREFVGNYKDQMNPYNPFKEYLEKLLSGVEYYVIDQLDKNTLDNTIEFEVPEGHYFFMGDNRDNSQDSRVLNKVGFVPEENIIGKAEIILFSSNAKLYEPWKWLFAFKKDRFLVSLHPIKKNN
ncbi:MAG: signal peptidase I [Alphaproteobacteria bacterium]